MSDIENGLQELNRASLERAWRFESVLLLGDQDTINAADRWSAVAEQLQDFARGEKTNPEEWERIYREAYAAKDEFLSKARKHLGVDVAPLVQR
ncbi:hypothetical protein OHB01_26190 [Microbispora hainanensis]|uniref:hypothetical protein n=1 Tax=Microbispora TaxID=2005 RepID=UPI0011577543|nr:MULTISPECIES: hypothetical protein [Microbispora]NJP25378.1 hypothetical protein [Microbispora sp. CL1-1]TQS13816.1 hypothetical protein FLW53_14485 [Microbispora sp. SCL1-1]